MYINHIPVKLSDGKIIQISLVKCCNCTLANDKARYRQTYSRICHLDFCIYFNNRHYHRFSKKTENKLKTYTASAINKGFKKFFYDLHVSGGFYTKLGLLVLALTGLLGLFLGIERHSMELLE